MSSMPHLNCALGAVRFKPGYCFFWCPWDVPEGFHWLDRNTLEAPVFLLSGFKPVSRFWPPESRKKDSPHWFLHWNVQTNPVSPCKMVDMCVLYGFQNLSNGLSLGKKNVGAVVRSSSVSGEDDLKNGDVINHRRCCQIPSLKRGKIPRITNHHDNNLLSLNWSNAALHINPHVDHLKLPNQSNQWHLGESPCSLNIKQFIESYCSAVTIVTWKWKKLNVLDLRLSHYQR